jgi:hypothetical protein
MNYLCPSKENSYSETFMFCFDKISLKLFYACNIAHE